MVLQHTLKQTHRQMEQQTKRQPFIPAISIAPLQVLYYSRLQHGYCIGVSRRSAQATAGKGLAQGPDVAARAGVEPTTLWLKVIISTKAPPRPTKQTDRQTHR